MNQTADSIQIEYVPMTSTRRSIYRRELVELFEYWENMDDKSKNHDAGGRMCNRVSDGPGRTVQSMAQDTAQGCVGNRGVCYGDIDEWDSLHGLDSPLPSVGEE